MPVAAAPGTNIYSEAAIRRIRSRYLFAIDNYEKESALLDSLADIPELFLMLEDRQRAVEALTKEVMRFNPSTRNKSEATRIIRRIRRSQGVRIDDWEAEHNSYALGH